MKKDNSVLSGKTALFVGDSISFGSNDCPGGSAWAGRIARDYGLLADNRSQSGWSLSTIRAGRIVEQVRTAKGEAYDYVILHGGVNDAWGDATVYAPVGKMTDSFNTADFDLSTYAGGLEELIAVVYEKYPTAKVGYILNFATPEATHIGHIWDMEDYYAQGLAICEKWGVQVLDLYHDPAISDLLAVHTREFLEDFVHPVAAGYERLYPVIGDWMETLTHNDKSNVK